MSVKVWVCRERGEEKITYSAVLGRSLPGKGGTIASRVDIDIFGVVTPFESPIDNNVGLDSKHCRAPHVDDRVNTNTNVRVGSAGIDIVVGSNGEGVEGQLEDLSNTNTSDTVFLVSSHQTVGIRVDRYLLGVLESGKGTSNAEKCNEKYCCQHAGKAAADGAKGRLHLVDFIVNTVEDIIAVGVLIKMFLGSRFLKVVVSGERRSRVAGHHLVGRFRLVRRVINWLVSSPSNFLH